VRAPTIMPYAPACAFSCARTPASPVTSRAEMGVSFGLGLMTGLLNWLANTIEPLGILVSVRVHTCRASSGPVGRAYYSATRVSHPYRLSLRSCAPS
jgi:hypothetical protein